jgi:SnoaL-like domain
MSGEILLNPRLVVERMHRAMNQRDVEALVECIDPLYHTEQPLHPDRAYRGREQIHKEWAGVFARLPDFHAELLRSAVENDTVWTEWHWSGTQANKTKVDLLGVMIFGIRNNRLIWTRMYMEPLQRPGSGLELLPH